MIRIARTDDFATCRVLRRKVFIGEMGVCEADELAEYDGEAIHLAAHPDQWRFGCTSAGNQAQGVAYACRHFGKTLALQAEFQSEVQTRLRLFIASNTA